MFNNRIKIIFEKIMTHLFWTQEEDFFLLLLYLSHKNSKSSFSLKVLVFSFFSLLFSFQHEVRLLSFNTQINVGNKLSDSFV